MFQKGLGALSTVLAVPMWTQSAFHESTQFFRLRSSDDRSIELCDYTMATIDLMTSRPGPR